MICVHKRERSPVSHPAEHALGRGYAILKGLGVSCHGRQPGARGD